MVEVKIPSLLQGMVGGLRSIKVEGETVEGVLNNLESKYPGFKARLINEEGEIQEFINLYLNDEDIRFLEGLKTKVKDGDILTILPAIAGGYEKEKHIRCYWTYPLS